MSRGGCRCLGALVLVLISARTGAATDTRLVDAIKSQHTAVARGLIQHGADVNVAQSDGTTALHWAVQWNDVDTVDMLLKAGAKANVTNDYGATPLWLAALNGSAPVVERLLAARADPNIALPGGETPLMRAARVGGVNAVRALARHGAALEAKESFRGQTALMWALAEHHLGVASVLLDAGANVNGRSVGGFTPLLFVAREGLVDGARVLLAHGAEIDAVDNQGNSALLVSTVRGHSAFAMFLLDKGANPNLPGPGYTALHWVSSRWETFTTADYTVDSGEWSRLIGVGEGRTELLKALLAHGADVNRRTTKSPPRFGWSLFNSPGRTGSTLVGVTPFFLASMVADVEVMRLLLAAGADPRISSEDNTTPLMAAAGHLRLERESRQPEANFLEATKLCLELGLDINARNTYGETPMHSVAQSGLNTVAQYLFDQGADVNARTKRGETPLGRALHYEIAFDVFEQPATAALLRKLGGAE